MPEAFAHPAYNSIAMFLGGTKQLFVILTHADAILLETAHAVVLSPIPVSLLQLTHEVKAGKVRSALPESRACRQSLRSLNAMQKLKDRLSSQFALF